MGVSAGKRFSVLSSLCLYLCSSILRLQTVSICPWRAQLPNFWKEFHLSFPAGGQLSALGGLPKWEELCVASQLHKQRERSGVGKQMDFVILCPFRISSLGKSFLHFWVSLQPSQDFSACSRGCISSSNTILFQQLVSRQLQAYSLLCLAWMFGESLRGCRLTPTLTLSSCQQGRSSVCLLLLFSGERLLCSGWFFEASLSWLEGKWPLLQRNLLPETLLVFKRPIYTLSTAEVRFKGHITSVWSISLKIGMLVFDFALEYHTSVSWCLGWNFQFRILLHMIS